MRDFKSVATIAESLNETQKMDTATESLRESNGRARKKMDYLNERVLPTMKNKAKMLHRNIEKFPPYEIFSTRAPPLDIYIF